MPRSSLAAFVLGPLLLVVSTALVRQARADGGLVIPPGREALVQRMLCERPDAPLPGGCVCDGVSIDRTFIRAKYACRGQPEAVLELRHPAMARGAAETTTHFALSPIALPPELLRDVARRVRAAEAAWSWVPSNETGSRSGSDGGQFPLILSLLAVAALSVTWWAHSSPPRPSS